MDSDTARSRFGKIILLVLVFLLAATTAFVATYFFKTKLLVKPGKITYGQSVSVDQQRRIGKLLQDFTPTPGTETTISIIESENVTDLKNHQLILDASVPVADFSSSATDYEDLKSTDKVKFIPASDLQPASKLLKMNGQYYLDSFTSGAKFNVLDFKVTGSNARASASSSALDHLRRKLPATLSRESVLSFVQTGVTALSRGMAINLARERRNPAWYGEKIAPLLQSADLAHLSNEVSFVKDCQTSLATLKLCSPEPFKELIKSLGIDIIELTGNHNNDYGATANLSTIDFYRQQGIKTFGGGKDETSAAQPLEIDQKNSKLTLIGINHSTSTKANGQGATNSHPGANIYSESATKSAIKSAKSVGRFVIIDVQFSECYSYPATGHEMPACDRPIAGQASFFRSLIDAGADLVVGTQAHQPQTFELYQGKPIYYGLGNLFFDQISWPGTTRSLILTHYFSGNKLLQTRLTPTVYGKDFQTQTMPKDQAQWFINRLQLSNR